MITKTRFYDPESALLTPDEVKFFQDVASERGLEGLSFVYPRTIMTHRVAMQYSNRPKARRSEYAGMGPFRITYRFSDKVRNNLFTPKSPAGEITTQVKYGMTGWSFRALYEFLCENFNGGYPFIDTYFGQVFKSRPVYQRFLSLYDDVQEDIIAQRFNLFHDMPMEEVDSKAYRNAGEFKVWRKPIIKANSLRIAKDIQEDIVRCLYGGIIPMCHKGGNSVSEATARVRRGLHGMNHPTRLFFASGQLIAHLLIKVRIADDADKAGQAA